MKVNMDVDGHFNFKQVEINDPKILRAGRKFALFSWLFILVFLQVLGVPVFSFLEWAFKQSVLFLSNVFHL
jgi:hypothetical protein